MDGPPTLIYDGDCGFCTSSARWIERRWPPGAGRVVAWQSLGVDALSGLGLTGADVQRQVWWIDTKGRRGGDRAIAGALLAATGAWAVLGRVLDRAPVRWIARPAYQLIAANRHLLPGATPACRL